MVSDQQILYLIKKYYEKVRNVKKFIKSSINVVIRRKIKEFRENAEDKLFDISACKCSNFVLCKCKIKVPVREREFLTDQRNKRKMFIGLIDLVTTRKIELSAHRKKLEIKEIRQQTNKKVCKSQGYDITEVTLSTTSEEEDTEEEKSFFSNQKTTRGLRKKKFKTKCDFSYQIWHKHVIAQEFLIDQLL